MDEYNALWTDLAELNDSKNLIRACQNVYSIVKWELSVSVCIRLICNFLPFEKILQYLLSIIIQFYYFAFGMSAISGFDMGKEDPFA